jgi:hypothetical protein
MLYRGYDRFDVFSDTTQPEDTFFDLIQKISYEYNISDIKKYLLKCVDFDYLEYGSFYEMEERVKAL